MKVLLPFMENGFWGFMDENAHVLVCPQYKYAESFSEGLASVKIGERWGYINESGEVEIDPVFCEAYGFCNGVAVVHDDIGYTIIDRKGHRRLPSCFCDLIPFDSNTFAVKNKVDKWGIIDAEDRQIRSFEMDDVWLFDDSGKWMEKLGPVHLVRQRDGAIVQRFEYESVSPLHDNMMVVGRGEKYGVIDMDGNEVLPLDYCGVTICNGNCIAARITEFDDFALYHISEKRWGNLRFDYCIDAEYNGMLFAEHNGRWSLYDRNENCVINDIGEEVRGPYYGKYWMVWIDETTMGYMVLDRVNISPKRNSYALIAVKRVVI